jgi:hypothetical protein
MFLHNLLNVLVQIANKMVLQKYASDNSKCLKLRCLPWYGTHFKPWDSVLVRYEMQRPVVEGVLDMWRISSHECTLVRYEMQRPVVEGVLDMGRISSHETVYTCSLRDATACCRGSIRKTNGVGNGIKLRGVESLVMGGGGGEHTRRG